ncbi:hypothetical protein [Chryseobacterium sp.]|uniref:hypothetical protein n=1 Tax=Chryseobacterium sp. TaxID=1871047 RepID=UPI0028A1FEE5|nr:hypothetical protein [Chryseobacterium sp.]
MLSENEILEIALKYIEQIEQISQIETVLLKDFTIKKTYGNIFFYTSKKYYETQDEKYNTLAGGGPFLIENKSGKIIQFGSRETEDYYIKEYEEGRWPI